MSWTDERVELLRQLWLDGKSASQISAAIGGGLTRNAVIGKVHRLGMAGRVKPAAAHDENAATPPRAHPAPRRAAPRPSAPIMMTHTVTHGANALSMTVAAQPQMMTARPEEEVVVPMSLRVTIVDLKEAMCKWPLGDPTSADFRYCGSPSHGAAPYCQHHGKLAYQPAQDRRRDRDRRTLLMAR